MYSARCGACIEVGPSPSLSSSEEHRCLTNRLECGSVRLASQCTSTFPLDTLFPSIACCAKRKPGRFDVETLDVSPSTRYEKVYGIVNMREQEKSAEWQVMQLSNTCI